MITGINYNESLSWQMNKIQKDYERRLKISSNNEMFVFYSRKDALNISPTYRPKPQESDRHQIDSLKHTMRQIATSKDIRQSHHTPIQVSLSSEVFNSKLDRLEAGLERILSHAGHKPIVKGRTKSQMNNQTGSNHLMESKITSRIGTTYSKIPAKPKQTFLKSNSFNLKSEPNRAKPITAKSTILQNQSQKSFKYIQGHYPMKAQSKPNKNLMKLFDCFEDFSYSKEMINKSLKESAPKSERGSVMSFEGYAHRGRITQIVLGQEGILSCSLDYTVKRLLEGKSEVIASGRAGVEGICRRRSEVFCCSRDGYIRSTEGFTHRMQSSPFCVFLSEGRDLAVATLQGVALLDMERKKIKEWLDCTSKYSLFHKTSQETYLASDTGLCILDWRSKQQMITLYEDRQVRTDLKWLSHPSSSQFCYVGGNQLHSLGRNHRKSSTLALPASQEYANYAWADDGLYLLTNHRKLHSNSLWKVEDQLFEKQTNSGADACVCAVWNGKHVYGHRDGYLRVYS